MKDSNAPVEQVITGGCLCGAVQFEVQDRFSYVVFCHCTDCQKQTGSAFTLTGAVAEADLKVIQGPKFVSKFAKSQETTLNFCRCCGSQLFAKKPQRHVYHVRLGSLERPPSCAPMAHVFYASHMQGAELADELPRFDAYPPTDVVAVALGAASGTALVVEA